MKTQANITEKHKINRLQCTILSALSQLGDPAASTDIQALQVNHDCYVREHILTAAVEEARRRGRDYVGLFHKFFHDDRKEVREEAISYLLYHADEKFIPIVAPLFYTCTVPPKEEFPADTEMDRLKAKCASLDRKSHEHEDARQRKTARNFVKACQSQNPEYLAPVLAVLMDPGCQIEGRIMALESLAYPHAVPSVVQALLDVLDLPNPHDEGLHGYAATSIGFVQGAETVIETLQKRLQSDRTEEIRHHVLYAITCLADRYPERCIPILESYLDQEGFQGAAVIGLQRAGAHHVIPRLRALYASVTACVRES